MHECAYHILKKKGKACLHSYITSLYGLTTRTHSTHVHTSYPSPILHLCNPLRNPPNLPLNSPAITHNVLSALILSMSLSTEGVAPSKTIALRCFQISHMAKTRKALSTLLWVSLVFWVVHQPASVSFIVGTQHGLSMAWKITAQSCLVKTHQMNRWSMLSSSWLQSGQLSW